jgi:hypothetical protein
VILRKEVKLREECIDGLKSFNYEKRVKILNKIDFTKIELNEEQKKILSFKISQTISLIKGIELYTKEEISKYYKDLKGMINRESGENDLKILEFYKNELLGLIKNVKTVKKNELILFYHHGSDDFNYFYKQCRGLIINIKTEKLVYYPIEWFDDYFNKSNDENRNDLMELDDKRNDLMELDFFENDKFYFLFKFEKYLYQFNLIDFKIEIFKKKENLIDFDFDSFFYVFKKKDFSGSYLKRNIQFLNIFQIFK